MAQLFDASRTWEIRDPYPLQAGDREPAITLPSLQVVPGAPDPIPKAFVPPFFSVQPLSRVGPFPTPWTAARQASLAITNSEPTFMPLLIPILVIILCPSLASSSFPPHAQPPPPPK